MPLSLIVSLLVSSLNACIDLTIHYIIFGSLGVEISFETMNWNKKTQWSLYLEMGLDPLVVLNLNA